MKQSYLIQRLKRPYNRDNPFAFGGGLRNGGLSDEAMELLRGVFSFDYMGAAEFEFGAVPKALQGIAANISSFQAFSFTFPLSKVKQSWLDKSTEKPVGNAEIYVICSITDSKEVQARIKQFAADGYNGHLKETTMLSQTLRPRGNWSPEIAGWLELDNGFFFFIDKKMWEKTAELFGIETIG